VDETAQKNTVLTLYELTESEATLSQGPYHPTRTADALLICYCRIPWHGPRAVAESAECSCKEGKGASIWPGRSTRCQIFLDGEQVTFQHREELLKGISSLLSTL